MSNHKYDIDYVSDNVRQCLTESLMRLHLKKDLKLTTTIVEYGYVVPCGLDCEDWKLQGGVLSSDFRYIAASAYHNCECNLQTQYVLSNIRQAEEQVIYIGQLYDCWGHVLTDNLSKVWYLFTEECQTYIAKGYKVIFTTIRNSVIKGYVTEVLSLAGIHMDCMQITQNTCFRRVIIPDSCFIFDGKDRYFTPEFMDVRDRICRNIDTIVGNKKVLSKVYLTRTHLSQIGREVGEVDIEKFYRKLGYAIVSPEKHSVKEQLSIVRHAECVAVTEGSVAHVTLFCRPKTEVHLLMKADYVNTYQTAINELANLNVTYIPIHHSSLTNKEHPWWGPFFLYVTRPLQKKNGLNSFPPPYWIKKSYWNYADPKWWHLYKRIKRKIKRMINL